jgi:hypothetical protein
MNQKHLHKEHLGYEVPAGYFESSKKEMLTFLEKESNAPRFFGTKAILATTLLGIMAIVFLWVKEQQVINYEINTFEELTIESLEVSDEAFDDWFDEKFVFNET